MEHVITQEDFDVNPIVTQLGLTTGDTITFTKAEVAPEAEVPSGSDAAPEGEAPAPEVAA
jgi:hypothetical protein